MKLVNSEQSAAKTNSTFAQPRFAAQAGPHLAASCDHPPVIARSCRRYRTPHLGRPMNRGVYRRTTTDSPYHRILAEERDAIVSHRTASKFLDGTM